MSINDVPEEKAIKCFPPPQKKVYFRSQILERKSQAILEHVYTSILIAIGQYCYVLDLMNIQELDATGTVKMLWYCLILEYSRTCNLKVYFFFNQF